MTTKPLDFRLLYVFFLGISGAILLFTFILDVSILEAVLRVCDRNVGDVVLPFELAGTLDAILHPDRRQALCRRHFPTSNRSALSSMRS